MSFESTNEEFPALAGRMTPEQLASQRLAEQEAADRKEAFMAQRQREMAKEKADADKESRARSSEILEKQVIWICMEANPNYSWHDAKLLYDGELKQLIAIERFKAAFFGQPTGAKSFGVTRM